MRAGARQAGRSVEAFIAAGARNEDGYTCPSAHDIATVLQQNPADAKGLNCLADFVRSALRPRPASKTIRCARMRNASTTAATRVPPTLGAAPSQFAGKPFERMSSYVTVMADAQANPNDRAYAYYRAIALCTGRLQRMRRQGSTEERAQALVRYAEGELRGQPVGAEASLLLVSAA